jgi:hypothetical protein
MTSAIKAAVRVARTGVTKCVDDFTFVPADAQYADAQYADAQYADAQTRMQSALVCAGLGSLLE